jgi:hypothetical protein
MIARPVHSRHSAMPATTPPASTVPTAAPAVPSAGIGPQPGIRTTFRPMFSAVIAMPRIMGVRASPADRSAPLSMKNTIMPLLKTNMMRRYGSASVCTARSAFTKSSNHGAVK